jgi:hypothetical protein
MFTTADRIASQYGVQESNPLPDGGHDWSLFEQDVYSLNRLQAEGGKVVRLRMLTEAGFPFLDISYCHGRLPNGRMVHINITCGQPRKGRNSEPYMSDLIAWAKAEGVYAKGLGLLDPGNWSILR